MSNIKTIVGDICVEFDADDANETYIVKVTGLVVRKYKQLTKLEYSSWDEAYDEYRMFIQLFDQVATIMPLHTTR